MPDPARDEQARETREVEISFSIRERVAVKWEERVETYTPESIREIWGGPSDSCLVLAMLERIEQQQAQLHALTERAETAERERDEARKKLEGVVHAIADAAAANIALTTEQDRLRAALQKIEQLLAYAGVSSPKTQEAWQTARDARTPDPEKP